MSTDPASHWMRRIARPRMFHGALIVFALFASVIYAQAQARTAASPSALQSLFRWTPFILNGFLLNLVMSFLAMIVATFAGLILGLMRISDAAWARIVSTFIVQIFRNTPWIVILFAVMLLFPFELRGFGMIVPIPDWVKATIGFSIPVAANVAEVVRGAILSVPQGQREASEALAFSRAQTLRLVILPQCVKRMIPPWMNWYAILALATPVASILGVREAVGSAQQAMEAAGASPSLLMPFYIFILLIFFLYIYPISRLTISLEKRYAVHI
ncbi:amino acid ABC transporter permease [Pseudorhodoplanes sp.]|uniref:amino acid ABC transporter permease n=1 Tax=Pseudorhodoplanes sp. TaxID=1934341 RepID=UPI003D0A47F0